MCWCYHSMIQSDAFLKQFVSCPRVFNQYIDALNHKTQPFKFASGASLYPSDFIKISISE